MMTPTVAGVDASGQLFLHLRQLTPCRILDPHKNNKVRLEGRAQASSHKPTRPTPSPVQAPGSRPSIRPACLSDIPIRKCRSDAQTLISHRGFLLRNKPARFGHHGCLRRCLKYCPLHFCTAQHAETLFPPSSIPCRQRIA
ncbi:hypothetical protein K461DRAFT_8168 [Myriangium duriaei CBS 260.36]|uniref:Uncharacterized protein n=1 Tax=Myriangium duriaei CBS 260.36 TaxID=1168546 RepID=A0A9P4J7U4_9PEZI|nr:hypothetical protein K461DRAFT_8168 [Myriangium duriaei CBS 260.36]